MKAFVLFFCVTLCWAQAADASGPVARHCVKNHLQAGESVKTPDQILCHFDGKPMGPEFLDNQLEQLKSTPTDPNLHLALGLAYLNRANTKRWQYLDSAEEHLKIAKNAYPGDPFVLMYLGRATGAQALDLKPSLYARLKSARSGFRMMDMAIKLHPNCVFLSLLRGEAQLMAHPILRRGERLKKDARKVSAFTQSSEFANLTTFQQARMHLFLGCFLEKTKASSDQVHGQWQLALEKAGETEIGLEAKARLGDRWEEIGYTEE